MNILTNIGASTYTIATPPKPVGYWILDPNPLSAHTMFSIFAKPTDKQIKNTEEAFGWKWKDA